ncbi:unnamed protein product, partial [Tetraodon nigroviridis]
SENPWGQCPVNRNCRDKFGDGSCDRECMAPGCLRDGLDCLKDRGHCNPGHIQYCRDHYGNSHCEQGCDTPPVAGTAATASPTKRLSGPKARCVLLQTPVKLRASAPMSANRNLFDFDPSQLASMLTQSSPADSDGGQQTMFPPADYVFPLRHGGRQLPAGHNNASASLLPHPAGASGHHQRPRRPRGNRRPR